MSRKTFDVAKLTTFVNEQLAGGTGTPEQRKGMSDALEHVLHATGNYNGFSYLSLRDFNDHAYKCHTYMKKEGKECDMRPGIRWGPQEDRYEEDGTDKWFVDVDETRRGYHLF